VEWRGQVEQHLFREAGRWRERQGNQCAGEASRWIAPHAALDVQIQDALPAAAPDFFRFRVNFW